MKTTFKLNMSADKWQTAGGVFKPGKNGGRYTGGLSLTTAKARKMILESLKTQGRTPVEVFGEDGYLTITAEG